MQNTVLKSYKFYLRNLMLNIVSSEIALHISVKQQTGKGFSLWLSFFFSPRTTQNKINKHRIVSFSVRLQIQALATLIFLAPVRLHSSLLLNCTINVPSTAFFGYKFISKFIFPLGAMFLKGNKTKIDYCKYKMCGSNLLMTNQRFFFLVMNM